MFGYDQIDLTFSINPVILIISIFLVAGYTFFVYRFTIPPVSPAKKTLLVILRTLAVLLLIFIILEPILTLSEKKIIEPQNYIFIDNSRSIQIEDGSNRTESIRNFLTDAQNDNILKENNTFLFGNDVNNISSDSLNKIDFEEGGTNFSNIFSFINQQKEKNISSLVIVSDGVITDGANPTISASKSGIPVFTVGVGDSSKRNDIEIKNVLYNELIYAETPTTIQATITNKGFANNNISVSLFEDGVQVDRQNISLNEDGIQNVRFNYTPQTGGEKKLLIAASEIDGEFTFANNRKSFFVDVLSNKIQVLVAAGAPSSDVSFIINSLKEDKNIRVNSIVQIAKGRFLKNQNHSTLIDSADILFLVGFPSNQTPDDLLNKVKTAIVEKDKPFFQTLSSGVDLNRMTNALQQELSFTYSNIRNDFYEVQPNVSANQSTNPIIQNNAENPVVAWNNSPPVLQITGDFSAKPESEVISTIKVNNVPSNTPLILSRKLGNNRSISVLADDIWKWKLQNANKENNLFDSFILNSVKWLNTSNQQNQVVVRSSKRFYSLGEEVEFNAQVYDEAFNPVSDAEVKIMISNQEENFEVILSSVGNGLYEGTFQTNKDGDYRFTGIAIRDGKEIGRDNGSFNIGEVDIEMIDPVMDYDFLSTLANRTGGKYFSVNDRSELFDIIRRRIEESSKEKIEVNEIKLWSSEWLMAIIILLFALEWFFRKRAGML